MINYIKSELYRILHTKNIYIVTLILCGVTLFVNGILFLFSQLDRGFIYGTVSFSLSNLVTSIDIVFLVGACIVFVLYNEKNNIKNVISYGISREKIFIGKCIVSAIFSICILFLVLAVFVGTSVLLLEPGPIEGAVMILFKGIACILIMAIAFQVLAIALYDHYKKVVYAFLVWYLIEDTIPYLFLLIGLKVDVFAKIAVWMPYNYLSRNYIRMDCWECIWQTSEGVSKCIISGIIGLVIFLAVGLKLCKKQEV